jgi:hypothetical protein
VLKYKAFTTRRILSREGSKDKRRTLLSLAHAAYVIFVAVDLALSDVTWPRSLPSQSCTCVLSDVTWLRFLPSHACETVGLFDWCHPQSFNFVLSDGTWPCVSCRLSRVVAPYLMSIGRDPCHLMIVKPWPCLFCATLSLLIVPSLMELGCVSCLLSLVTVAYVICVAVDLTLSDVTWPYLSRPM